MLRAVKDFIYSFPKMVRIVRVGRDEVGEVALFGSRYEFMVAVCTGFESRQKIRTSSAFPKVFQASTSSAKSAKSRGEPGIGVCATREEFGDEWSMTVEESLKGSVVTNEERLKRARWVSNKTRTLEIRQERVNVKRAEVTKSTIFRQRMRQRRDFEADDERQVVR